MILRSVYRQRFGSFGRHASLRRPICLRGAKYIHIGAGAVVKESGWLEARPLDRKGCELRIGAGSSIGYFYHIYATRKIVIGPKILMGSGVYITDCTHGYEDPDRPIIDQPARTVGEVSIGEGSWIGQHAAILGVRVGKHCMVGANAVVTKDIPNYCVVAGAPARVLRTYDSDRKQWINC
ncbi:MAG: acyltransferase [Rikenellaceae bacterium]|nr:acyltransferase [Rikenellaceae bacterium]